MKKIFCLLLLSLFLVPAIYAAPTDIADFGKGVVIEDDGELTVSESSVTANMFECAQPFMYMADHWTDLPTTSSAAIYTSLTQDSGTWKVTTNIIGYTAPIPARNLYAVLDSSDAGTTADLIATGGVVTVTGYDAHGDAAIETISFSTTTGTGAVAFSSITVLTVKITNVTGPTAPTKVHLHIGSGTKIGLTGDIISSANVYYVGREDATDTVAGCTINATYDTIIFGTAPDASNDYKVLYYSRTKD